MISMFAQSLPPLLWRACPGILSGEGGSPAGTARPIPWFAHHFFLILTHMSNPYQRMWRQALPLLQNGQVDTDPMIFSKADTRRGLTLRLRPPAAVLNKVQSFQNEARSVEPEQYYYPREEVHLTALTIISCRSGFGLNQIDAVEYQELIKNAVEQIAPFRLVFRGITASPGAILIQGFDESGHLNRLRQLLRENFNTSRLEHTIDKRYKIETAHLTVVRFTEKLAKAEAFFNLVKKYRNNDFGVCQATELELVFNDWYHRREHTRQVCIFPLGY